MRLIADGVIDRSGVPGLAAELGYSVRQLERLLLAEVGRRTGGAGPGPARPDGPGPDRDHRRCPMADVAFGAGFASIRQFNDTVRAVFGAPPSALRARRPGPARPGPRPGSLVVRLPFRRPLRPDNLFGHLAATAVPGVEEVVGATYRRTLRLAHGPGRRGPHPGAGPHRLPRRPGRRGRPDDGHRPLPAAARPRRRPRGRRPGARPATRCLAPLVAGAPGPAGAPDRGRGRVRRARRARPAGVDRPPPARPPRPWWRPTATRSTTRPVGSPTSSRRPSALADAEPALPGDAPAHLGRGGRRAGLGSPRPRSGGRPRRGRGRRSAACPASAPGRSRWWPCGALGDPDAFPVGDLGRAAGRGRARPPDDAGGARRPAPGAWRPWRAYAVQHLWATTDHPVNRWPPPPDRPPHPTDPSGRRAHHGTGGAHPCLTHAHPRRPASPSSTSPIGPLTLMARGGRLTNLAMDGQAHAAAAPPGQPAGRRRLRRRGRPARRVLRRRAHRVRRAARPGGHRRSSGPCGRSCCAIPYGRDRSATASWPAGSATRRRRAGRGTGQRAQPGGRSSCRATG